jgi:cAMP-dependent protein kinase regulator
LARDPRQLREDATEAAAAGKHKRALECYLELERLEPSDAQWPKRVAETYRRLGKMRDAVSAFERAADRYAQNGFLVQAIAVCKLILQIDPSHVDTQQRLAAINAAQGAGPTRVGVLSDNHPSLHENPAVALLRGRAAEEAARGRPPSAPPTISFTDGHRSSGSSGSSGNPASASGSFPAAGSAGSASASGSFPAAAAAAAATPPPHQHVHPSGYSPGMPSEPSPAPDSRYSSYPTASASPAGGQGAAPGYLPSPSSYAHEGQGSGYSHGGYGHGGQASYGGGVVAAHGSPQSRSQPIHIERGAALDTVPLGAVVAGSHQQRDDGSQPGIVIIPIDGEDSNTIDVILDEESSRAQAPRGTAPPYAPHGGFGHGAGRSGRPSWSGRVGSDPAIELDLAELEAEEDPDDIPLASPRLVGAAARLALAATPLFAGLSEPQLEALISRIDLMTLAPGQVLFREGEHGDSLYVISDGEVAVEALGPPRVEPVILAAGAFFGEVTLITDHPRMATVTARTMVEALRIDRDALAFVVARHPEVVTALLRFVRDRLVERWMRTSPLCRPFAERERREFASRFRFLEIEPGSVVMAPGDQADGLYIVLAGQFVVRRDGQDAAYLGPGELIGETVLMTGAPLHSTVMAATKCLALWLPVEHFREVIMIHPHVLEYVGASAERRRLQIF